MKSFSRDTPSFATFSAISAALHQKVVTENLGHRIGGHDPVKGKSPGFPTVQIIHSGFSFIFSSFFSPAGTRAARVVRCFTTQEEDVLLCGRAQRAAVESAPARDQAKAAAGEQRRDLVG